MVVNMVGVGGWERGWVEVAAAGAGGRRGVVAGRVGDGGGGRPTHVGVGPVLVVGVGIRGGGEGGGGGGGGT